MSPNPPSHPFNEWLKNHAWGIIVASVMVVTQYVAIEFKLDEVIKDVDSNHKSITTNTKTIQMIQLQRAADNAAILTELKSIAANQEKIFQKLAEYDKNILEFYKIYELKPKGEKQ